METCEVCGKPATIVLTNHGAFCENDRPCDCPANEERENEQDANGILRCCACGGRIIAIGGRLERPVRGVRI